MATTEYDDELFLEALEETESATTADIAEKVGCAQKTAYLRLKRMDGVSGEKYAKTIIWGLDGGAKEDSDD